MASSKREKVIKNEFLFSGRCSKCLARNVGWVDRGTDLSIIQIP